MKNGYLFFFNMGNITKGARIGLLPAAFFVFLARGWLLMILSLVIMLVCIILSVIHAPSDKTATFVMDDFYKAFEERTRLESKRKEISEYAKGYLVKGKMFLKRHIGNQTVYPTLMTLAVFGVDGESFLLIGQKTLVKEEFPQFRKIKISGEVSLEPLIYDESTIVIKIVTGDGDKELEFVTEYNYRIRDFLTEAQKFGLCK